MATTINRIRVTWSGFRGGPGVSTHYCNTDVAPNLTALKNFYTALAGYIPAGTSIQIAGDGDTIDYQTGALAGSWTGTKPTAISCTASGGYSGPTGAIVRWKTDAIHGSHRLKGRTFIVPVASGAFTVDGQVYSTLVSAGTTAAQAMITAAPGHFVVWGRPNASGPGVAAPILSGDMSNLSAVLRSRRD